MHPIVFLSLVVLNVASANEVPAEPESFEAWTRQLNELIVTASKKEESLFNTPASASVITHEEIIASGATSIQEVFRLIPGFIVREQTHGNFDIHLRGMDNIPDGMPQYFAANTKTLVMIDGRGVYSHYQGGTMWERFHISLVDIDRIEVVRGPSAALHGPNAVAGVVNIITRKDNRTGPEISILSLAGTQSTGLANLSASYGQKDRWHLRVSGNIEHRNRKSNDYYDFRQQKYVDYNQIIGGYIVNSTRLPAFPNPDERFPKPDRSLETRGLNLFGNYKWNDKVEAEFSTGWQHSFAQKAYFENIHTALSSNTNTSRYLDVQSKTHGLRSHFAFYNGTQDILGMNLNDIASINPDGSIVWSDQKAYNFTSRSTDVIGELAYEHVFGNYTFQPQLSGQWVQFDAQAFGGKKHLSNVALSLRNEYALNAWHFIGALRLDKYNIPNKPYYSYQVGATRTLGQNHLVRFIYSKANKAHTFSEVYYDIYVPSPQNNLAPPPPYLIYKNHFRGNADTKLETMDTMELGHRAHLSKKVLLDTEAFFSRAFDLRGMVAQPPQITGMAGSAAVVDIITQLQNMAHARQWGLTSTLTYNDSARLQHRFFATVQYTEQRSVSSTTWNKSFSTPMLFGGFIVNYKPTERININVNPYFRSGYRFQYGFFKPASLTTPVALQRYGNRDWFDVSGKFIINAKVGYKVMQSTELFVDARNLLNTKSVEFAANDDAGGSYFVGLEYHL